MSSFQLSYRHQAAALFALALTQFLPAPAFGAADSQADAMKLAAPASDSKPVAKPAAKPPGKPAAKAAAKPAVPPQMADLMARREALCKKRPQLCGAQTERIDPAAAPKNAEAPLHPPVAKPAAPAISAPANATPATGSR